MGGRPFLCSQGAGGGLTHFAHPSTHYAIDLEAPVGTLVVAIAAATVLAVDDRVVEGGVHVALLFRWNALVLQLDDGGAIIELVHVRAHSARVAPGARVVRGQPLCEVGDAGFCPVPHLHIEAHATSERRAPSIPLAFACHPRADEATAPTAPSPAAAPSDEPPMEGCIAVAFTPVAGRWYDECGEAPPPPEWDAAAALRPGCEDGDGDGEDGSSSSGWETVEEDSESGG